MKILLRVLLGFLAFLVLLYLLVIFVGTPLLKSSIEKQLSYYPGDRFEIGLLELQFFPLGLEVNDISFDIHQPGDSLMQRYTGELDELKVVGIDWWRAVRHNTWEAERTEIDSGQLSWIVTSRPIDKITSDSSPDNQKNKADLLLELLEIKKLKLQLIRDSTHITLEVSADADSLGFNRGDKLNWALRRLHLHSEKAMYQQLGGDYDLSYHSLCFHSENGQLQINDLKVIPRMAQADWDKKYPQRKPLIQSLRIPSLRVDHLDIQRLKYGLFAAKIQVDSLELELFNDLRDERPQQRKKLPSEMIAAIPIPVSVDSVTVDHAALSYRYIPKSGGPEKAELKAGEIALEIYPFSNLGHSTAADVNMNLRMQLMDEALLQAQASYAADQPNHPFELRVSLSPASFAAFNPLIQPSLGLQFKSGYCSRLQAQLQGDDQRCDGSLQMAYEGLKLQFPKEDSGWEMPGELKEFGANTLLVNNANEWDDDIGIIAYERPENMPFIAYWWRGLQSGLLSVLLNVKDSD